MLPNKACYRLLLGTILGSLPVLALADTTISTETNTPLLTQSAGDITIEDDGSIEVDSGVPVTIDSANDLTIEEGGAIVAGEDDGATGVLVTTAGPFSIFNEGEIIVEEDFVPEDDDSNNIPDGAIASSSGRAGIRITTATQGTIENEGLISVEGLYSYGILAEDSFTGDIINEGAIAVIGDYSTGISLEDVDGNISLVEGSVSVVGEGSQALVINGDVTGTLNIQGSVGQEYSYTNDDGDTMTLSRGDLRVSSPAVEIAGDVDGGILIASRPYDLDEDDEDEDNDGTDDDSEGAGTITSYGVSPALYIGGTDAIDIGAVEGRDGTFSLAIDGAVSASGIYSTIDAIAIEIGGDQTTTLSEGIGVSGTVSANTYDSSAIAILLNETAVVPYLYNSGTISATISSSGDGSTIAIQDLSGTLTTIDNSGYINAGGSREDIKVAVDVSDATSGITFTQYLNDIDADAKEEEIEDDEDYNPENPTIYTAVYGDLLLSNYADVVDVSSGLIDGHTYFNDGDDTLTLSDDAVYDGNVYGGAGQLTVTLNDTSKFYGTIDADGQNAILNLFDSTRFTGTFANAQNLTANVDGGTLFAEDGEVASLGTLNVGSGGAIGIIIDGEDGTSSSFDVGTANFEDGSTVRAEITSITDAEGTYQVLTADDLNGTPTFDPESNDIPLLFDAELTVEDDDIFLTIERKTSEELGFNNAQDASYDSILEMLDEYETLEQSILQAENIEDLQSQFQELLPDYSGGVFEFSTLATRMVSARINSESKDFFDVSEIGGWISPFYFQSTLSGTDSEDMTLDGKGIAGAIELFHARGTVGIDASYTMGDLANGDRQDLELKQTEIGVYYRRGFGPFYTYARLGAGQIKVESSREFNGNVDGEDISYAAEGAWKGLKLSATAGVSASFKASDRLTFTPGVNLDYHWLKEKAYTESGDEEIVLDVDARTSSRLSGLAKLTTSIRVGGQPRGGVPMTLDATGGYRFNLVENLGETTAAFEEIEDATAFTISSPSRSGLWHGELKLHGGGQYGTWGIIAAGEKGKDQWSASARAVVSVAF